MCKFYCTTFLEYITAGTTLLDYTNLFSPNDYQKNNKIINELMSLMSEKQKKVGRVLNYFEHFLAFVSAVSGCISISTFASLVGVVSSAVGIKLCAIIAEIKKYNQLSGKGRKSMTK